MYIFLNLILVVVCIHMADFREKKKTLGEQTFFRTEKVRACVWA
jgi:hypothetical protein